MGRCVKHRENDKNAIRIFCLKPLWMRPLQTSELRQEDNIKMGLTQTGCEYMNRIKVTQDRPY
jgi:hypothetical protein